MCVLPAPPLESSVKIDLHCGRPCRRAVRPSAHLKRCMLAGGPPCGISSSIQPGTLVCTSARARGTAAGHASAAHASAAAAASEEVVCLVMHAQRGECEQAATPLPLLPCSLPAAPWALRITTLMLPAISQPPTHPHIVQARQAPP